MVLPQHRRRPEIACMRYNPVLKTPIFAELRASHLRQQDQPPQHIASWTAKDEMFVKAGALLSVTDASSVFQLSFLLYSVRCHRTTNSPIIEAEYPAAAMKNGSPIHAAPLWMPCFKLPLMSKAHTIDPVPSNKAIIVYNRVRYFRSTKELSKDCRLSRKPLPRVKTTSPGCSFYEDLVSYEMQWGFTYRRKRSRHCQQDPCKESL